MLTIEGLGYAEVTVSPSLSLVSQVTSMGNFTAKPSPLASLIDNVQ